MGLSSEQAKERNITEVTFADWSKPAVSQPSRRTKAALTVFIRGTLEFCASGSLDGTTLTGAEDDMNEARWGNLRTSRFRR